MSKVSFMGELEIADKDARENIERLKINKLETFSNVNAMINSNNLFPGSIVETLGFYNINDGGGSKYLIRSKTENDVIDSMLLHEISDTLVAELLFNSKINILTLGAKPDDETDNKSYIDRALELLPDGGVLYFPNGVYKTSGSHNITTERNLTVCGNGKRTTHIKFIGTDYCFYSSGSNDPIVSIIFKDMRIDSNSIVANNVLFKLSDRWGYELRNILSYGNAYSIFCEFYNDNYWTEGGIIENCMIRSHHYGIVCNRNVDSVNNTNSFFNVKILKTAFDLNQPGARAINLGYLQNADYPIICYNWDIDITVWFGSTGGGKNPILVGNYNTLTGKCYVTEDGTGLTDGTDFNTIYVHDNSYVEVEGNIFYRQGSGIPNIKFNQLLKQYTNWKYNTYKEPIVQMHGLKMKGCGVLTPEQTGAVVYTSGNLPPFTNYLLKLTYEGGNTVRNYTYSIVVNNLNLSVRTSLISGEDENLINVRPINNVNQGSYSEGNGLQFEIYCNEATTYVTYNFELIML